MSSRKGTTHLQTQGKNVAMRSEIEENILPSPIELQGYQAIDQKLVEFFREGAVKEQDFRHEMHRGSLKLNTREQLLVYGARFLGTLCAVGLLAASMSFSYFLISSEMSVEGTIFGGGSLVLMAYIFLGGEISAERKS
jgi:uncharacterized membrane protein